MASPQVTVRVPAEQLARLREVAQRQGWTLSSLIRGAALDRCEAVETITHAALRVEARRMADELRTSGNQVDRRAAGLIDALLLDLAVTEAMYGPVVA